MQILLQIPIFIALFAALTSPQFKELVLASGSSSAFLCLTDLSDKDPYFIWPILMGVAMVVQQKMTPSATMDPMQQKMMMFMPVIFAFFMIPLPSGLVIYILFSTVLQIASQWLVNKDLIKQGL